LNGRAFKPAFKKGRPYNPRRAQEDSLLTKKFPFHETQGEFQIFSQFQVLFQSFIKRPCYFVNAEVTEWWFPFSSEGHLYPSTFGMYFGKSSGHDRFVRSNFKRAREGKVPFISRFGDYIDVTVPFLDKGRYQGCLISGPVLEKCPTAETLRLQWKAWTGVEGSNLDRDFLHFARVALNTAILDREGLEGYLRLLELLVLWVTEPRVPGIGKELNRLRVNVFSRQLPHPYWVDWAIGKEKFFAKPDKGYVVPQWVREEVGVSRAPTVAAALMPRKPGINAGSLEVLCQGRKFQQECYRTAREWGEIACAPLGDYGAVVLTSAKPHLSPAQARMEIREKIQALGKTLGQKLRMTIVAGVGSITPQGATLLRSYHEAVASLHSAAQEGKNSLTSAPSAEIAESPIPNLIRDLGLAMALSSPTRLAHARENFTYQLLYTGYGPEITKAYMLSALYVLLEQFERRTGVGQTAARTLGAELMDGLESAHTIPDLVGAFRESIDRLAHFQGNPREASVTARLNRILADISKEPQKPWRLSQLSQRAELSPPTFLKWFKKVSGQSFGPYVRKVRLLKAEVLLTEGNLTLERIAQECGFASASTFSIIFHRTFGTSPRKYIKSKKF
jgi:AraC-like DNA-binding protein